MGMPGLKIIKAL